MADNAFDLVIVGGGPAGLATAICARLEGLQTVVLDRRRPPIDRACGEGLMPIGLSGFEQIGVALTPEDGFGFSGIRYIAGRHVAEGRFRRRSGLGVRRTRLHQRLVDRASELGADLRWGVTVSGLSNHEVSTSQGFLRGSVIVAADGRLSQLRRRAGLQAQPRRAARFGIRRHYRIPPWTDLVEVYWGDGCETYVTPVAENEVGVAILSSGHRPVFDELLTRFDDLRRHLDGAPVASRDRGAGPFNARCRSVVGENIALVGDASGVLDAISGEGLTLAMCQAQRLVMAIARDDLSGYASEHRRLTRMPRLLTNLLLHAASHPGFRSRLVASLAANEGLFSDFVSVLGEGRSPWKLNPLAVVRFAARLVVPA